MIKSPWMWVAVLTVLLLTLIAYSVHQARVIDQQRRTIADMSQQRDLGDGTTVSGSLVGTIDDVKAAAADAGVPWDMVSDDAKDHGAAITGVNVTRTQSDGQRATGLASSGTIPRDRSNAPPGGDPGDPSGTRHIDGPGGEGKLCVAGDPWGYQNAGQVLRLDESFAGGKERVPFGSVVFRAWEKAPWSVDVPPRTYTVATVLATDDEGKQTAYNRVTVEVEGKTHVVPIKTAQLTQTLPDARWRWSSKLYLGVGAGTRVPAPAGEVVPSAAVSIASYGKTPLMPDWTVGVVGVGYATQAAAPAVVVAPVLWNAGKPIPLIDNLYAGPSVSADTKGNVSVMVGAHVKM